MAASPIPESMKHVIPYLVVPNAEEAMSFYAKAFDATSVMHMPGPGGQGTMHAEIELFNSTLMLTDENPQWEMKSPKTMGGSPISLMIYVEDVDKTVEKAVAAGCEVKFPVDDMFWGDRMGKIEDPYGYQWSFATHVEDVPHEEMGKRQEAWLAEMQQKGGEC